MVKDILICKVPFFTSDEDIERVEAILSLKTEGAYIPLVVKSTNNDELNITFEIIKY